MTTSTIPHCTVALPAIGTPCRGRYLLGFAARAKPGSGLADYALIVPEGVASSCATCLGGSYGKDHERPVRTQACQRTHSPGVQLLRGQRQSAGLYLHALRELKTLFANGCPVPPVVLVKHAVFRDRLPTSTSTPHERPRQVRDGGCARFVRQSSDAISSPNRWLVEHAVFPRPRLQPGTSDNGYTRPRRQVPGWWVCPLRPQIPIGSLTH